MVTELIYVSDTNGSIKSHPSGVLILWAAIHVEKYSAARNFYSLLESCVEGKLDKPRVVASMVQGCQFCLFQTASSTFPLKNVEKASD